MIVYRIQNKQGRGPFYPGFSKYWLEDREDLDNLLPWTFEFPELIMIAMPYIWYGCGCDNVDQLRRWFTKKEYMRLKSYGFESVKLKVNRILAKSDIQCVFERREPLFKGINVIKLYN